MRLNSWLLLGITFIVVGCASSVRSDKFDLMARAYDRALRNSDYLKAFGLAGNAEAAVPDFQGLQNIRITSCEEIAAPQMNANSSELVRVVEIRYVNVFNMRERVLTDQQLWAYSESDGRWKLRSPFPAFP